VRRSLVPRFSLFDLLLVISAFPVCIGIASAIEYSASNLWEELFGFDWRYTVRRTLIDDVGIPVDFVTEYVTFAINKVPAWVCYCVISSILGLLRTKWVDLSCIVFIISIGLWDFYSDYIIGLHASLNLRVVSLFGVFLATVCLFGARKLRRHHAMTSLRNYDPLWIGIYTIAIAGIISISVYGWFIISLHRSSGIELQKLEWWPRQNIVRQAPE